MGSVFQRGDSWVIEYKNLDGRIRRESIGKRGIMTKTIAREILQKKERQVKLDQYDMLDAEIPTLADFTNDYLSYVRDTINKRSWKRDELCLRHLKAFFKYRKLSNIKSLDIDD